MGLLSCVQEEVSLEQQLVQDLPEVTGFTATSTGCLATLEREHDGERYVVECGRSHTQSNGCGCRVKVEVDALNAVEVVPDELVQDEEVEEEVGR